MPPIKQQLAHLKNAGFVSVEHFKKQKLECSQFTNTEQLRIEDNQLCTSNTSNTKDRKGIWFWNENANKTNSSMECGEKSNKEKLDCGPEGSKTEKKAVLKTRLGEIKWNKEREKKLREEYSKISQVKIKKNIKVTKELEKEAFKIYNIMAFWQYNQDFGLICEVNTHPELAKGSKSDLSCKIDLLYPLSRVLFGCALF